MIVMGHFPFISIYIIILYWLVVSTPLKNISQLGLLYPIYGKNVPNHRPVYDNMHGTCPMTNIMNHIHIMIPLFVMAGSLLYPCCHH